MSPFERLAAWREAYQLALAVYRETESFPKQERFEVTAQIRRAVISVPANIAEGCMVPRAISLGRAGAPRQSDWLPQLAALRFDEPRRAQKENGGSITSTVLHRPTPPYTAA
ncbi:MAG: four helix bundle protein [Gemmatimonadetes bacterium]|nr:four helix bundle protein [Gemmatimonadota bacterium]